MVNIRLHGILGESFGDAHRLSVKSVGEAIHALNLRFRGKLYQFFRTSPVRYKVLINQNPININIPKVTDNTIEIVRNSDLVVKRKIQNIDIIPIIELADEGVLGIVLGAVLIIAGAFTFGSTAYLGTALIAGGVGVAAAGVMNLLAKPPNFEDFRDISNSSKKASYLFNGPQNIIGEGGPVPVGYGRLIVGSQTISASYDVFNIAKDGATTVDPDSDNPNGTRLLALNFGGPITPGEIEGWQSYTYYTVRSNNPPNPTVSFLPQLLQIDTSGLTTLTEFSVLNSALTTNHAINMPSFPKPYISVPIDLGLNNGDKNCTVIMYFADWVTTSIGGRLMKIFFNGSVVEDDFDILATAGQVRKAISLTKTTTLDGLGRLNIDIIEKTPNAFATPWINALELYVQD